MLRLIFAWLGASLVAILLETAWLSCFIVQLSQLFLPIDAEGVRQDPPQLMPQLALQMSVVLALYALPTMLLFVLAAARISRATPKYVLVVFVVAGAVAMWLSLATYALIQGNDPFFFELSTPLIGMIAGLAGGLIWQSGPAKPAAPPA